MPNMDIQHPSFNVNTVLCSIIELQGGLDQYRSVVQYYLMIHSSLDTIRLMLATLHDFTLRFALMTKPPRLMVARMSNLLPDFDSEIETPLKFNNSLKQSINDNMETPNMQAPV